jgi:hypothetical protein
MSAARAEMDTCRVRLAQGFCSVNEVFAGSVLCEGSLFDPSLLFVGVLAFSSHILVFDIFARACVCLPFSPHFFPVSRSSFHFLPSSRDQFAPLAINTDEFRFNFSSRLDLFARMYT